MTLTNLFSIVCAVQNQAADVKFADLLLEILPALPIFFVICFMIAGAGVLLYYFVRLAIRAINDLLK